jgi:transcriptional regulator with PAS, ATPase and Fis domain
MESPTIIHVPASADHPDDTRMVVQVPHSDLDHALKELGIYLGTGILRRLAENAAIAAREKMPVLLLGETGTGKEGFAHLIHKLSPRRNKEIMAINCATIPKELAESFLFGHTKGSFTGALNDKAGVFEEATGTTLFLDEIAELPLEQQAKLLRVIQDGVVLRVGCTIPRRIDVRIIAATNRDLKREVAQGHFREDLYFRLEVIQIKLPPLRERREEIVELALMLFNDIVKKGQKRHELSMEALQYLKQYSWPGNVRELINVLSRSALYARSDILTGSDLDIRDNVEQIDEVACLPEPTKGFSLEEYLATIRKQLFLRALKQCNGNQTEAAVLLGISKQAVSQFVSGQGRLIADNVR